VKDFECFCCEITIHVRYTGDIATGMSEALYEPRSYWVRSRRHYNRNGRCGRLRGRNCGGRNCNDNIGLEVNDLLNEIRQESETPLCLTNIDSEIFSLFIPEAL